MQPTKKNNTEDWADSKYKEAKHTVSNVQAIETAKLGGTERTCKKIIRTRLWTGGLLGPDEEPPLSHLHRYFFEIPGLIEKVGGVPQIQIATA